MQWINKGCLSVIKNVYQIVLGVMARGSTLKVVFKDNYQTS